jgi:hypothetical protein
MSYLNAYGKKRRFQEGGVAPAAAQFKQVLNKVVVDKRRNSCCSGYCGGDQAAAAQLGAMLAPMILQRSYKLVVVVVRMAPQEAQPVFRRGKFVGRQKQAIP